MTMTPNENEARELLISAFRSSRHKLEGCAVELESHGPDCYDSAAISAISEALSLRDSEKRRADEALETIKVQDAAITALHGERKALTKALDEAEAELARVREALAAAEKAMSRILPYLIWTVGDESPGYHPTLPSAVGAFKYSLNEEVRKALPTPPERA